MTGHRLEKHLEKLGNHHAHLREQGRELAEGHAAERDLAGLQTSTLEAARLAGAETEGDDHGSGK